MRLMDPRRACDVDGATTCIVDQGEFGMGQGFWAGVTCCISERTETSVYLWRRGSVSGVCIGILFVSTVSWMGVGVCGTGVLGGAEGTSVGLTVSWRFLEFWVSTSYIIGKGGVVTEWGYCVSGVGVLCVWSGGIVFLEWGYCVSGEGVLCFRSGGIVFLEWGDCVSGVGVLCFGSGCIVFREWGHGLSGVGVAHVHGAVHAEHCQQVRNCTLKLWNVVVCLSFWRGLIVTDLAAADKTSVIVNDCRPTWWLTVNSAARNRCAALAILLLH